MLHFFTDVSIRSNFAAVSEYYIKMTWRNVTFILIGGKVIAFSGQRVEIQKNLRAVSPVTMM
jgi:hypothetical protein